MAFKTSALIIWNKSFPYCWRSCGEVACTWFCNEDVSSLLISSLLRAKKALICKMKTTHCLVLPKLRRSFSELPTRSMSKTKENCMHGYEHVHMATGILEKGKILQNTYHKHNTQGVERVLRRNCKGGLWIRARRIFLAHKTTIQATNLSNWKGCSKHEHLSSLKLDMWQLDIQNFKSNRCHVEYFQT